MRLNSHLVASHNEDTFTVTDEATGVEHGWSVRWRASENTWAALANLIHQAQQDASERVGPDVLLTSHTAVGMITGQPHEMLILRLTQAEAGQVLFAAGYFYGCEVNY